MYSSGCSRYFAIWASERRNQPRYSAECSLVSVGYQPILVKISTRTLRSSSGSAAILSRRSG